MLIYSAAAGLYLATPGLARGATGALLWPAVALHLLLAALLARRSSMSPATSTSTSTSTSTKGEGR